MNKKQSKIGSLKAQGRKWVFRGEGNVDPFQLGGIEPGHGEKETQFWKWERHTRIPWRDGRVVEMHLRFLFFVFLFIFCRFLSWQSLICRMVRRFIIEGFC